MQIGESGLPTAALVRRLLEGGGVGASVAEHNGADVADSGCAVYGDRRGTLGRVGAAVELALTGTQNP
jgi:hypothetical protein